MGALRYCTIIIIIAFLTRFHQLRIKNHLSTPAKKGFSEGESSANRDWFCECCLLCAALLFIDVKNVCSALLTESAFDQKKKGQKKTLLVNNLFNIFCNVKMVFNIYYRSKVLQILRKNPDFLKIGIFEILYLYLSCYKTICCCSQTGPERMKIVIHLPLFLSC